MRVIFFGTPAFAVPSMEGILRSRHEVAAVVTQPDRPKGRSKIPSPPAVKEAAMKSGIPILQPEELRRDDFLGTVSSLSADLGVVVAYGRLLPPQLIQLFKQGAVNLHASLLPRYRGAAPIQWALIQGESETGVTIFQMNEQLDHGPILLQESVPIGEEDTAVNLGRTLSQLGSRIFLDALDLIESGSTRPRAQEESLASQAPRLKKEDGIIDWRWNCRRIHDRVRGVQPWPGAVTFLAGEPLKVFSAHPDPGRHDPSKKPGTVVTAQPHGGFWIQTGQGQLQIRRLQSAGGKVLEASDFLRGHPLSVGTVLTSPLQAV